MQKGLDGVKPSVSKRYLSSIRNFDPLFGDLLLEKITTKDIAEWVNWRKDTGQRGRNNTEGAKKEISNATIRRDLTALSRLMSFCCAIGWRCDNPVQSYDRSIVREKREPKRPPTEREVAQAIAEASPGMAGILRILSQTGMRMEEAVTLEAFQIDYEKRQILLTRTKSNRPRALSWETYGGNATDAILAGEKEGLLYRSGDTGEAFANFSSNHGQLMRRMVKANPEYKRFNVHSLRHAFAIRWLKNGGSLYALSRHLGHSSVKVTEHSYLGYLTIEEQERVQLQSDL
ncbi:MULTISPECIES: tyrosine-type recombinase/integrase [unclassified Saccharibacter]|uniref:tyrosine-type recombinase/integrase n=1 Tax=unclassified Saccharibacter TaxID=2648722 RepID=UPI001329CD54|nr:MULTISPECIES: tyrosine-type recombinase/integrase [unclassified Saccharibacter]MXV35254.1 tyrosine-type recombinase/integrase [Saccharibacter sp. EH611]MXV57898.1 tyrosine-type recombinase/integrase [Saccharibacter sp. EH70]MXV65188.1 tyrosine-type recombinase/integrase [Saccharibacter sp. EH60]MXV65929.1 tyrosine-type recombinase/integrase [Saccharibacter sp. EH60]